MISSSSSQSAYSNWKGNEKASLLMKTKRCSFSKTFKHSENTTNGSREKQQQRASDSLKLRMERLDWRFIWSEPEARWRKTEALPELSHLFERRKTMRECGAERASGGESINGSVCVHATPFITTCVRQEYRAGSLQEDQRPNQSGSYRRLPLFYP